MSLGVRNGFQEHSAHPWFLLSAPSSPIVHLAPGPNACFFFIFFSPCLPAKPPPGPFLSVFLLQFSPGFQHSPQTINLSPLYQLLVYPFSSVALEVSSTSTLSLALPVAAFVSLSPFLSISISLCLSASCESVLVLIGLAMGCSAKCSGALGQNTCNCQISVSFSQQVAWRKARNNH